MITEMLATKGIDNRLKVIQDRIDIEILNDIEKLRTECFSHYNYNHENEERLHERIKALGMVAIRPPYHMKTKKFNAWIKIYLWILIKTRYRNIRYLKSSTLFD